MAGPRSVVVIFALLKYSLTMRTGRGLEDLGTGYCHSHGLGWLGDTVSPDQIVGEVMEASNGSSTNNTINIYWSVLVLRPACVDTLIITTQGNQTYKAYNNPGDSVLFKEFVAFDINICKRTYLKIRIFNKRGGYNVNIGELNLIRRRKNENHEYNLVIEGAFEHNGNRKGGKISGEILQMSAQTIHMDWKKSLEVRNISASCVTELTLREKQRNILRRRVDTDEVSLLKWERQDCFSNPELTLIYKHEEEIVFTENFLLNYSVWENLSCDFATIHSSPVSAVLVYGALCINLVIMLCCLSYICSNSNSQNHPTTVDSVNQS